MNLQDPFGHLKMFGRTPLGEMMGNISENPVMSFMTDPINSFLPKQQQFSPWAAMDQANAEDASKKQQAINQAFGGLSTNDS